MVLNKLRRLLASLFQNASPLVIVSGCILYLAISYLLLLYAKEVDIVDPNNFIYWMTVTASTVGYGDYSPTTFAGKMVTSLWVIPVGLSLFALILAKGGILFSEFLLKGKKGLRMINYDDHIVIIGWNGTRTLHLIDLITSKTNDINRKVVLCVDVDIENPVPDRIDFVKVESFTHQETMSRANLSNAASIIVDTDKDDITLTTALYVNKVSPDSHKTAYFQDEIVGDLLKSHCPKIECIPSVSVEMLAKSTLDPGSARLHRQLLDSTYGMNQYSLEVSTSVSVKDLFNHLKHNLNATLIGVRINGNQAIDINPPESWSLEKGDRIFYISASRLSEEKCFNLSFDSRS